VLTIRNLLVARLDKGHQGQTLATFPWITDFANNITTPVIWANRGDLVLVESSGRSPKAYKELARKSRLIKSDAWPHVVLSNRRLYCKDWNGVLMCFRL
jgi:hypothetical protein